MKKIAPYLSYKNHWIFFKSIEIYHYYNTKILSNIFMYLFWIIICAKFDYSNVIDKVYEYKKINWI